MVAFVAKSVARESWNNFRIYMYVKLHNVRGFNVLKQLWVCDETCLHATSIWRDVQCLFVDVDNNNIYTSWVAICTSEGCIWRSLVTLVLLLRCEINFSLLFQTFIVQIYFWVNDITIENIFYN